MFKRLALLAVVLLFVEVLPGDAFGQKRPWVAPKTGIWQLKGIDNADTSWTAVVRLVRLPRKNGYQRYRGHFDWKSDDGEGSGKEFFTGAFDRKSGRLKLKAHSVKSEKGVLGVGNYTAFVRQKGRKIVGGKWFGNDVVPGTWNASWLRAL